MTPEQLYAALDARRHELSTPPTPWWWVAVQLDIGSRRLADMRRGHVSAEVRERAEEWLRRPVPPQQE